jgi:glycosyltransferase involved in cell wall biosynthesis
VTAPRLVVDARAPEASGLGRYLRESLVALSQTGRFEEITLVGPAGALQPTVARMRGTVRVRHVPWRRHDLRVPLGWRRRVDDLPRDVITWFPHWDGAWRGPWQDVTPAHRRRPVTTLHDVILLERGGVSAALVAAWMRRMIRASRALVTGTEVSRAAFAARLPEVADRIVVIPHGVAPACLAAGAAAEGGQRTGLPPAASVHGGAVGVGAIAGANSAAPYLLCVGTKRPHKRFEVAIEAFAHLAAESPTLRLRLVGERTAHAARLHALAARLGVAGRLDDLEGLDEATLAACYAGADAVLVCSRAEGFGMVPLEAMAAGAPVVATRHPTTREVVGTAAALVAEDDAAAMAAVVRAWWRDGAARAATVQAGLAHARRFTWARSAGALADVLLPAGA